MPEKKLTPQERAKKFAEGYRKLCEEWRCQHEPYPELSLEGRVIAKNRILIQQVNDG